MHIKTLETNWQTQDLNYSKAIHAQADARVVYDAAKVYAERIKALHTLRAYKAPEEYNIDKATDSRVTSAVTNTGEVQSAVDKMISAKSSYEHKSARVLELENQRRALQALTAIKTRSSLLKRIFG